MKTLSTVIALLLTIPTSGAEDASVVRVEGSFTRCVNGFCYGREKSIATGFVIARDGEDGIVVCSSHQFSPRVNGYKLTDIRAGGVPATLLRRYEGDGFDVAVLRVRQAPRSVARLGVKAGTGHMRVTGYTGQTVSGTFTRFNANWGRCRSITIPQGFSGGPWVQNNAVVGMQAYYDPAGTESLWTSIAQIRAIVLEQVPKAEFNEATHSDIDGLLADSQPDPALDVSKLLARIESLEKRVAELEQMPPGRDGATGRTGPAGNDGLDGKDGADGRDGKPGVAGRDGVDGKQGPAGVVTVLITNDRGQILKRHEGVVSGSTVVVEATRFLKQ